MRSERIAGVLAVLGVLSVAPSAAAFCRTTTCDPATQDCTPLPGQECTAIGKPLYWPSQCVSYSLQQDATPSIPFDTFTEVTRRAFQSWLTADCGGGNGPGIQIHETEPVSCNATEYNQYAGNANIIMFRTTAWPYQSSSHTLALTTVTFNTENAQIYDVDIEVNAAEVQLTTGDENVRYDLEAILAHEIGHYFGLAHSGDTAATMFAQYKRGTVDLRTPEQDDHEGICTIYPSDRNAGTCDPTPRHGFKSTCGDGSPPEEGRCSVSEVGPSGSWWPAGLGLVALFLLGARRRRDRCARGD